MGFESFLAAPTLLAMNLDEGIPAEVLILCGIVFVLVIVSTMRRNKQEAMRKEYWAKKMEEKEAEKQDEKKS